MLCGKRVVRLMRRGRPLRRRRDRGRRPLPGARGGGLDDPRQAPDRDGARRAVAGRLPLRRRHLRHRRAGAWASTWRRASRRASSRSTTRSGPRCRPGCAGFPEDAIEYGRALRRRPLRRGPGVDPGRHADARGPVARARGPPHGQVPLRPVVRLRGAQGVAGATPARARARGGAELRRGRDPRHARQGARGHRARQRAHDPRDVPRREPHAAPERRAAPGAGLGAAPDADPGPLPDRRHDAPGRLDHRRARPQRRDGRCCRTSARASRRWWMPDARVQAAVDHWGPRFIQAGVDANDFARTTARIETWDEWLGAWCETAEEHAALAGEAEAAGRAGHRRRGVAARGGLLPLRQVRVGASTRRARATPPTGRSPRCARRTACSTPRPNASRPRSTARRSWQTCGGRLGPSGRRWSSSSPGSTPPRRSSSGSRTSSYARGMATLSLDGPGQGEGGYELPLRHDFEAGGDGDPRRRRDGFDRDRAPWASASAATTRRGRRPSSRGSRAVAGISGPFSFGAIWDHLPPLTRETFVRKSHAADEEDGRRAGAAARPRRRASSSSTSRPCS